MTLTLDLPLELERELSEEAQRQGLPLADYALHLLATSRPTRTAMPQTGDELVAYWEREGLLGSRSDDIDSSAYARDLRDRAERRGHE